VIDDLWKMGKPVGRGGPWKDSEVGAGIPSDPYLIGFYDDKKLILYHDAEVPVWFTIEVEPIGHGTWMTYKSFEVPRNEHFQYNFPDGFQARWIRMTADRNCKATAWFEYD
jgi:hypothetical protein